MKKFLIILLFLIFLAVCNFVIAGTKIKEGKVIIDWETKTFRICPPGILGEGPCKFPTIIDVIKKVSDLILKIAPLVLVILIILGGFMYLLAPIKFEQIQKGHRYIQYAIYGFFLLLLVSLIFTFISLIFGGPNL